MEYPEGTYYPLTFFEGGWKSDAMSYPLELSDIQKAILASKALKTDLGKLTIYGDFVVMSDTKETLEAAHGQKVSEVKVAPTPDGKPPYTRKIKTEKETVDELKGITISTEADPDYNEEAVNEGDDSSESGSKPQGE